MKRKRGLCALLALLSAVWICDAVEPTAKAEYTHIHDRSFVCNDKAVPLEDLPIGMTYENCWKFAQDAYTEIWGQRFSEFRNSEDDMLRGLDWDAHTLTAEHLKAYVTAARIGGVMRLCNGESLDGDDEFGHSQIILQRDDAGFTVYEGNIGWNGSIEISYYTWDTFIKLWSKYDYIKYVKWPGAETFRVRSVLAGCELAAACGGTAAVEKGTALLTEPDGEAAVTVTKKTYLPISVKVRSSGANWYGVRYGGEVYFLPEAGSALPCVSDCTAIAMSHKGIITSDTVLWSLPCDGKEDARSKNRGTAQTGTEFLPWGGYVDSDGVLWVETAIHDAVVYFPVSDAAFPCEGLYAVEGEETYVTGTCWRYLKDGTVLLETAEGRAFHETMVQPVPAAESLVQRPETQAPVGWRSE